MKRVYIILFTILPMLMVLSGCSDYLTFQNTDNTSYATIPLNTHMGTIAIYSKTFPQEDVGAAIYRVDDPTLLLVIVRIKNSTSKPITLTPADLKVSTISNYSLKQIALDTFINYKKLYALDQIQDAEDIPIQRDYITKTTVDSAGQTEAATHTVIATTSNVIDSEYDKSVKRLQQRMARNSLLWVSQIQEEIELHYFNAPKTIDAGSWDYYFMCYENIQEYPIQVRYHDARLQFTKQ